MPANTPLQISRQFAEYCCELLATQGPCVAKRMFGGWGISTEGLTIAIIADLGAGEKLWLKADEVARGRFEAAGCERFVYLAKAKPMSMGYYTAPEDAMDSPDAMRPWARLALEAALRARAAKPIAQTPRKQAASRRAAGGGEPSKASAKRAPAKTAAAKAVRKSPQA